MNNLNYTLIFTILFLAWLPDVVAQAQDSRQDGDRFERMDRLMERMHSSRDTDDRRDMMREHMQMMQQQMRDMDCMRGEGVDCLAKGRAGSPPAGRSEGGMMGGGSMGGMGGAGTNDQGTMRSMQQRMDMMHRMMGHMLDQQQMMMDMDTPDDMENEN